jgi:hypothetical protein
LPSQIGGVLSLVQSSRNFKKFGAAAVGFNVSSDISRHHDSFLLAATNSNSLLSLSLSLLLLLSLSLSLSSLFAVRRNGDADPQTMNDETGALAGLLVVAEADQLPINCWQQKTWGGSSGGGQEGPAVFVEWSSLV